MTTENTTPETQGGVALAVVPQIEQNLPSDAKNKAISDLTAACYQKASQLQLTKEEIAALSADFPDEAFQPGAAGKENLIYIEHAALRERLDQVIGMGQWCMIPIRRWEEQFDYQKDEWSNGRRTGQQITVKGSHVYVDGIMLIRGAFVASAIGEMTYYPDNHTQNYGDAVEGAETAALRRCCKRLGIGLQAWRKDWCLGWWQRKNSTRRTPFAKAKTAPEAPQSQAEEPEGTFDQAPPQNAPQTPPATPRATSEASTIKVGPKYRLQTLNRLQAAPGGHRRAIVHQFLTAKNYILPTEEPENWPLEKLPKSAEEFVALGEQIQAFERDIREGRAVTP